MKRALINYAIGWATGTVSGLYVGSLIDWKAAKQMFKRRPQAKQLSFEQMLEGRPKYRPWIRGLNKREPK
jgi:hypothetical protein